MTRGPAPKSEALRAAQGTRRHRKKTKKEEARQEAPAAALEPVQEPAPPAEAPPWLSAKSKTVWKAAAPALFRQGLLKEPDAIAFGRYCDWLAQYLELQKGSRRRKVVSETKSRHVKMQRMDKGFQALQMIDKTLRDYEDRFGMNPRERLAIMKALAESTARPPAVPPRAPAPVDPPPAGGTRVEGPPAMPKSPVGFLGGGRLN